MANNNGVHHVVNDVFTNGDKSLCGKVMWRYDMPITLEHAKACIDKGTYLQPCKRCMNKSITQK